MHRMRTISTYCVLALASTVAHAEDEVEAGKALAEKACSFCHGPDGNGNNGSDAYQRGRIPRIAGQPLVYLVKTMKEYKAGTRTDDDMNIVCEQLSEQEIADVAAWYAG